MNKFEQYRKTTQDIVRKSVCDDYIGLLMHSATFLLSHARSFLELCDSYGLIIHIRKQFGRKQSSQIHFTVKQI